MVSSLLFHLAEWRKNLSSFFTTHSFFVKTWWKYPHFEALYSLILPFKFLFVSLRFRGDIWGEAFPQEPIAQHHPLYLYLDNRLANCPRNWTKQRHNWALQLTKLSSLSDPSFPRYCGRKSLHLINPSVFRIFVGVPASPGHVSGTRHHHHHHHYHEALAVTWACSNLRNNWKTKNQLRKNFGCPLINFWEKCELFKSALYLIALLSY